MIVAAVVLQFALFNGGRLRRIDGGGGGVGVVAGTDDVVVVVSSPLPQLLLLPVDSAELLVLRCRFTISMRNSDRLLLSGGESGDDGEY